MNLLSKNGTLIASATTALSIMALQSSSITNQSKSITWIQAVIAVCLSLYAYRDIYLLAFSEQIFANENVARVKRIGVCVTAIFALPIASTMLQLIVFVHIKNNPQQGRLILQDMMGVLSPAWVFGMILGLLIFSSSHVLLKAIQNHEELKLTI